MSHIFPRSALKKVEARSGQSLMEVVVAMGILVMFAAAFMRLVLGAYEGWGRTEAHMVAGYYAEEALVFVQAFAHGDLSGISDGTYGLSDAGGVYKFVPNSDSWKNFTRVIKIESDGEGGKLITVSVNWISEKGKRRSRELYSSLTDWQHSRWLTDITADFDIGSQHSVEITDSEDGGLQLSASDLSRPRAFTGVQLPESAIVRDIHIDHVTDLLYVLTNLQKKSKPEFLVYDISGTTDGVTRMVDSVDLEAGGRAFEFTDTHAYVLTEDDKKDVRVLRLSDLEIVATWDIKHAATPIDIVLSEDGSRAYVITNSRKKIEPDVSPISFSP